MKVSGLGQFALGQAVPNRDHAVCVSLPEVKDLIGYEEKHPETISKMSSGYPRFVEHRFLNQLISYEQKIKSSEAQKMFLFANRDHCKLALENYGIKKPVITEHEQYTCLQVKAGSKEEAQIRSSCRARATSCNIDERHQTEEIQRRRDRKRQEDFRLRCC